VVGGTLPRQQLLGSLLGFRSAWHRSQHLTGALCQTRRCCVCSTRSRLVCRRYNLSSLQAVSSCTMSPGSRHVEEVPLQDALFHAVSWFPKAQRSLSSMKHLCPALTAVFRKGSIAPVFCLMHITSYEYTWPNDVRNVLLSMQISPVTDAARLYRDTAHHWYPGSLSSFALSNLVSLQSFMLNTACSLS